MNKIIVEKIKNIRVERNLKPLDMAERLNISLSAYNKLESGSSNSWSKYLEDILNILGISYESFFEGINSKYSITNKKGSIGGNIHVEHLYADSKEKSKKIEEWYEKRLSDKDAVINALKDENISLKADIKSLENKTPTVAK